AGAPVSVITGSANHDEDRYEAPEEGRIDRPPQNHVAFGTGQHQCLGMHLAPLEPRGGLGEILARLPHLRPGPPPPPPAVQGSALRGPEAIPVVFDPS